MKTIKQLLIAALLLVSMEGFGQYVQVRDSLFGQWLSIHYSGCVTGTYPGPYQLDTTCPAILATTSINSADSTIGGVPYELIYFKNLDSLDISNIVAAVMPPLPSSIKYLGGGVSQIDSFASFPASLRWIYFNGSGTSNLRFPAFPDSLVGMYLLSTSMASTLPVPPHSLKYMKLESYHYSGTTAAFPSLAGTSLDTLIMDGCVLQPYIISTIFPALPPTIKYFSHTNELGEILYYPTFPDSVTYMVVVNGMAISIPNIPALVQYFDCSSILGASGLQCIGHIYSNQLQTFKINGSHLSCMPNRFTLPPNFDINPNSLPICTGAPCVNVAGPDQNICVDLTATMAGIGTGTWASLSSNPATTTITDTTSPTTTIAGFTIPGVYGFIWAGDTMTVTVNANTLVVTDSTHVNVSCFGATNGSLCISVTGGTPGYTYSWSNGESTPCAINLNAAGYTVTVSDANHCTATLSSTITQPASALQISLTAQNTSCPGGNDGGITTGTTGGTTPYTYAWSPFGFGFTPDLSSLPVGYYCVTVTDGNGCTATGCDSVRSGSGSCLGAGPDQTICENDSVRMAAVGSGFWTPLSSNPSTVDIVTSSSPTTLMEGFVSGVYGFIWSGDTVFITALPAPDPLMLSQSATCLGTDTLTAQLTAGTDSIGWMVNYNFTQPYNPFYTSSSANNTFVPTTAGTYYAFAIGSNGCTSITIDSQIVISCLIGIDTVWPGDADANHLVDNNDLLTLGLGYDSTGPARTVAQQSIVWQADTATYWSNYFTNYSPSVNFNNADCNGDGVIDANDTTAITANFGLTHAKSGGTGGVWRSGIPALTAKLSQDTLIAGDTLIVTFVLGDSAHTITNFYGIAFTYNFDPLVVDSTFTSMSFGSSWIGTSADKISISKILNDGAIKAAVTRIDHISVSGYGPIATASFKITTDNISGKTFSYYPNFGSITDITAIDQLGNKFPLNAGADTSQIAFTPNGIADIQTESLHIQPNPAHDRVTISAGNVIQEITINNVIGQEVMNNTTVNRKTASLDISALSSGVYFVQVKTNKGAGTVKLVVER